MNKKAQETAIYGFVAILAIFLLLILYWVFFVIPTIKVSPTEQSLIAKERFNFDLLLLNYLKTPVTVNGQQILMSDLIRIYYSTGSHLDLLNQESINIFDNVLSEYNYNLKIGNIYLVNDVMDKTNIVTSTTEVPNTNENIEIKLEVEFK